MDFSSGSSASYGFSTKLEYDDKKMDLVNRERSLKNFINYLKERELCGSEINS